MRRTTSPNLSPLQFLRIVAAEYLAAYELTGQVPASLSAGNAADFADDFLASLEDEDAPRADVFDISKHPTFDSSALRPEWDQAAAVRPSIGA